MTILFYFSNVLPNFCGLANTCQSTEVAYSNFASSNSLGGRTFETFTVVCIAGYSGGGLATCSAASGTFNSVVCTANLCNSTQVAHSDKATPFSINGTTGQSVNVVCNDGYSGGGFAECLESGRFSTVMCDEVICPTNSSLQNNVCTCNPGYSVSSSSSANNGIVCNGLLYILN